MTTDFIDPVLVKWEAIKAAGWWEGAARLQSPGNVLNDKHLAELRVMENASPPTVQVSFTTRGPERWKSGDRKGELKWGKDKVSVFVTRASADDVAIAYENATGRCKDCENGQAWCGWSMQGGSQFRPCDRCGATGRKR